MTTSVQHEQQQRGSLSFPAECYHVDYWHPRYEMPFHWHIECEFITVLQGSLKLLLNGTTVELNPNKTAFIPGGVIHGGYPLGNETVYECIVLDLDYFLLRTHHGGIDLSTLQAGFSDVRYCFSKDVPNECETDHIIRTLFNELRTRTPGYEFFIMSCLWRFAGSIIRNDLLIMDSHPNETIQRSQQINQAIRKIRHDYNQPLTLEDVSATVNMTPGHFCRVFRKMTGHTFIQYLNRYRIYQAVEQIQSTDLSLTEIALQCGFNDLSYFSRIFRKYREISPREYRMHCQEKQNQANKSRPFDQSS